MKQATLFVIASAIASLTAVGCSSARTPDQYSIDTHSLLASKSPAIKECYDGVLRDHTKAAGTIVMQFTVQHDTGAVVGAAVKGETQHPHLAECVKKALEGLVLAPPDPNDGQATFTWEFTVGPTPPPAVAPPS